MVNMNTYGFKGKSSVIHVLFVWQLCFDVGEKMGA